MVSDMIWLVHNNIICGRLSAGDSTRRIGNRMTATETSSETYDVPFPETGRLRRTYILRTCSIEVTTTNLLACHTVTKRMKKCSFIIWYTHTEFPVRAQRRLMVDYQCNIQCTFRLAYYKSVTILIITVNNIDICVRKRSKWTNEHDVVFGTGTNGVDFQTI